MGLYIQGAHGAVNAGAHGVVNGGAHGVVNGGAHGAANGTEASCRALVTVLCTSCMN